MSMRSMLSQNNNPKKIEVGDTRSWYEQIADNGWPASARILDLMRGSRIVVAEANSINRLILSRQLAAWRFDFAMPASGNELVSVLNHAGSYQMQIDCIVISDTMPDDSVDGLFQTIRSDAKMSDTPIVMVLSKDEYDLRFMRSLNGIQAILSKPMRSSALIDAVLRILQKNKYDGICDHAGFSKGIAMAKLMGRLPSPARKPEKILPLDCDIQL